MTEADPEWCVYFVIPALLPCSRDLGRVLGVTYYVDNDMCQPECLFSTWMYEEANGVFWLQRDDEIVDNTCGGEAGEPDKLWF